MIGYLNGKLIAKQAPELLIDVGGVGYEVYASMHTFYQLPEVGQTVALYIHFVVREDAQVLYGFYDRKERSLFRELIKVNGVGPKIALAILSGIDPEGFIGCVANDDITTLVRMPGIGKKTAERLLVEMRDKLRQFSKGVPIETDMSVAKLDPQNQMIQDAVSALVALGYRGSEAASVIAKIHQVGLNSEELIRLALKDMVKK